MTFPLHNPHGQDDTLGDAIAWTLLILALAGILLWKGLGHG